jgi:hypothetical protein
MIGSRHRILVLLAALACAAVALWPAAPVRAAATSAEARAAIEAQLALERRLLARDVAAHAGARSQQQAARGRLEAAAAQLDDLLRGAEGSLTLANFERLEAGVAAAQAGLRVADEQVEEVRRRLGERLRRIAGLQEELGGGPRVPDPLSGRWRVRVLPQNVGGVFELRLDGTLVSGKYQLESGPAGSLRGTFVDNAVRLERIDAQTGFDTTFLGAVDGAAGRISGTWHANELAAGAPASGQWTAVREAARP